MLKLLLLLASLVNLSKESCRDLTYGDCEDGVSGAPFETLKDLDEENCQLFCNQIFEGTCKFYILDRKHTTCELYDYEPNQYVATCNIIGSTPQPEVGGCATSNDVCDVSFPVIVN